MGVYMIQGSTMEGIAGAIREKARVNHTMRPGQMPEYIRSISTVGSHIPDYIVAEANRVAGNVAQETAGNCVTFVAMADMHRPGDGELGNATMEKLYRRSCSHAGWGAAVIAEQLPLDFAVHLGDLAYGTSATSVTQGVSAIAAARADMGLLEARVPCFLTPGNHDPLTYSCSRNGGYLSPELVAGLVGDYGLWDLEEKKLRIILLNTADNRGKTIPTDNTSEAISAEQLRWFAQSLDLSGKTDGAQWKILVFSHHPLDWGNARVAGDCLGAYLAGAVYSVTHQGETVSYDFRGRNAAQVLGTFHGHTHCFRVDALYDHRSGSPVATGVKRIAIPNAGFDRNNPYGNQTVGGLNYGEGVTYAKSSGNTAGSTAFCLVSVNLDSGRIRADCFGAGYDRIIEN